MAVAAGLLDGIGALLLGLIPVLIGLNGLLFSFNAAPGVLLIQICCGP